MRRLLLVAALLCSAAAPPTYTVTADEEAQLAKGKVVIRHQDDGEGLGGVVAFVDVAADPNAVLDAAMDLQARKDENSSITALEIYDRSETPEQLAARWTLSILGSKVVFHIRYACHRAERYCDYALDESKDNDIVSSVGHYVALPHGRGTRLIYASRSESGRSVPGFIKRWIAGSSLQSQVENIRDRAQKR